MGRNKKSGKVPPLWYDITTAIPSQTDNSILESQILRVEASATLKNPNWLRNKLPAKNYTYLAEASKEQLIRELEKRLDIWHATIFNITCFPPYWKPHWESIKSTGHARPESDKELLEELGLDDDFVWVTKNLFDAGDALTKSNIVKPICVAEFSNLINSAIEAEALHIKDGRVHADADAFNTSISLLKVLTQTSVHTAIDLRQSNEAIAAEVTRLADIWRSELEAFNRNNIKNRNSDRLSFRPEVQIKSATGDSKELYKIKSYKVIETIDTLIYAAYEENIFLDVTALRKVVFGDEVKDSALNTTHKNFIKRIFSRVGLNQLMAHPKK